MSGYVRAQRARFNHHLFAKQKFCRGYAWDWMIAQARFTDTQVSINGKTVVLRRGQFSHSIRFMAEAWNWDKAAVDRFIARLKTEAMIETGTETGQLVVTICNYDEYQADQKDIGTPNETAIETGARQERDRSETKKNKDLREQGFKGEERNPLTPNTIAPDAAAPSALGDDVRTKKEPTAADHLAAIIGEDLARDFIAHRKALKKPMTPRAGKILAEKLASMTDPGAAVLTAIERGWLSAFEVSPHPNVTNMTRHRGPSYAERLDASFDALTARLAVQPFPTRD